MSVCVCGCKGVFHLTFVRACIVLLDKVAGVQPWGSELERHVTSLSCWLPPANIKSSSFGPWGLSTFAGSSRTGIVFRCCQRLNGVYLWLEAAWLGWVWVWAAAVGPVWSPGSSGRWTASVKGSCRSPAAFGWTSSPHTLIGSRTLCLLLKRHNGTGWER